MTLTPLRSLESAKKQFLMKSTYIMSTKWESNVFGLRNRPEMMNSNTGNQTFARNDSARKKKIFDELDVHHV